jgi:hypothetical protein
VNARRFIWILAAALVAVLSAAYFGNLRQTTQDLRGGPLLPGFGKQLNQVTGVTIRKGGARPAVNLRKQGDRWTVAERADYPADVVKLRELLLAISRAVVIEEKSSDPVNYRILGVEDPSAADAAGTQITIDAANGPQAVIVGKPAGRGNFVRLARETRSFLVEPGIPIESQPRDWIDTRLLDIAPALIQRVEIKPPAGPAYVMQRISLGTFDGLTVEDVAPAAEIDFKSASVAILTLADGNQITLTGAAIGERRWLTLSTSKDPSLTEKTRGRAYEIASSRYQSIFKP